MFGPDEQNNQQQHHDDGNGGDQQPVDNNPAAPPPDHEIAQPPQQAYEAIFDEHAQDNQAAPTQNEVQPQQPEQQTEQPAPATPVDENGLLNIKQQALQQLSPLVGQLEQSPEEKFHTTMRIIQASDNHSLLKDAYAAAQEIADDKVRAQALLDVINEINYFTNDEAQNGHAQQPEQAHGEDSTL